MKDSKRKSDKEREKMGGGCCSWPTHFDLAGIVNIVGAFYPCTNSLSRIEPQTRPITMIVTPLKPNVI